MGLLDFLFKDDNFEYKRDVPENIRQNMYRMLDKILDMEDDGDSCYLNIKLGEKIKGTRALYPIKRYRKALDE